MNPDDPAAKVTASSPYRTSLLAMGAAVGMAVVGFGVLAFLPPPKGSLLDDPLRSILTGVAVAGLACPLCITGLLLKRRYAASPYYEGGFIAGVLRFFGYLVMAAGLACIGFGLYDLLVRFLDSRPV